MRYANPLSLLSILTLLVGHAVATGSADGGVQLGKDDHDPTGGDAFRIAIRPGTEVIGKDSDPTASDTFRVRLDPSGALAVNGRSAGAVDPRGTFEVTVNVTVGPLFTTHLTTIRTAGGAVIHRSAHCSSGAPAIVVVAPIG